MQTAASPEERLAHISAGLSQDPGSVPLRFERARLLDILGRNSEAERAYRDVLALDASHFGALTDLGMLLYKTRRLAEALRLYALAVTKHPTEAVAHANFGFMLLKGGDARGARDQYEAALALAPENIESHRGLALALSTLGDNERSNVHRAVGFDGKPFTTLPFRGSAKPVPILVMVSAGNGNLDLAHLLDDRIFLITKVVAEHADRIDQIPEHHVVMNAIGDADIASGALALAQSFLSRTSAPVLNHPERVLATGRAGTAKRLAAIDGLRVPRTEKCSREELSRTTSDKFIASLGLHYPMLLRAAGFHTGQHFARVANFVELTQALGEMPGDDFFLIESIDVADADGSFRKYRTMIIDGDIYPVHAATSRHWKVHYFSADMTVNREFRDIDEQFLTDPVASIGDEAFTTLRRIAAMLRLDYAGVDFGIDACGRVVLFEANAVMVIAKPSDDARFHYRHEPIARVGEAVRDMLIRRSALTRTIPT